MQKRCLFKWIMCILPLKINKVGWKNYSNEYLEVNDSLNEIDIKSVHFEQGCQDSFIQKERYFQSHRLFPVITDVFFFLADNHSFSPTGVVGTQLGILYTRVKQRIQLPRESRLPKGRSSTLPIPFVLCANTNIYSFPTPLSSTYLYTYIYFSCQILNVTQLWSRIGIILQNQ